MTLQFYFRLAQYAEELMERWALAYFQKESEYETQVKNALALGQISLIEEILEQPFEDLMGDA